MSKPGEPTEQVGPDEQIKIFLDVYRDAAQPAVVARLTARVRELSLTFTEDELVILAALDTPARVRVPQHAGLLQQRSRLAGYGRDGDAAAPRVGDRTGALL